MRSDKRNLFYFVKDNNFFITDTAVLYVFQAKLNVSWTILVEAEALIIPDDL
jgi:hypothetical protein